MVRREQRRLRDEGEARFGDRALLNRRYRMGNLLGKGGFSDVYLVRALGRLQIGTWLHANLPTGAGCQQRRAPGILSRVLTSLAGTSVAGNAVQPRQRASQPTVRAPADPIQVHAIWQHVDPRQAGRTMHDTVCIIAAVIAVSVLCPSIS